MASTISINILANTAQLLTGMNKAEKAVKNSMRTMTKVVGAFAGLFLGGSLINGIKNTSAEIDKMAKASQRLGVSIEALTELGFAAEQTGVSTSTLEMALQRMNRRVSEATLGTGEAKDALAELGLSAQILANQSADKTFKDIADAMELVDNTGRKTALAMKIFDTEGVKLLQTMQGGKSSIEAYGREMQQLGIITSAQSKDVTDMNDSFNSMNNALAYLGQLFTATIAPVLTDITTKFKNLITQSDLYKDIVEDLAWILGKVAQTFGIMGAAIMTAISGFSAFKELVSGTTEELTEAQRVADEHTATLGKLIGQFLGLVQIEKEIESATIEVGKAQANQLTLWQELGKAAKEFGDKTKTNATVAKEAVEGVSATMTSGITKGFRDMMDGADNWGKSFENIIKDVIAQLIQLLIVQRAVSGIAGSLGFSPTAAASVSVPARAIGGGVRANTSYLVGEHGAELFTPATNGTINNSPAGGGTTVNVINNTTSQVDVQEDEAGQIDIIISKISNDITRGVGSIGNAFENRYGISKQ